MENKQVDKAARSALSVVPEKISKIPYTDLEIKKTPKYIQQQRQHRWDNNTYNKLLEIKPISSEWKQNIRKSQKKQVILSRSVPF